MSRPSRFIVNDDHMKLLARTYITYNDWTEYGAPEVNPKRPYGNSDVTGDIAEILGWERRGDDEDYPWGEDADDAAKAVHKQMEHVLQILVMHPGENILGTWVLAETYGHEWVRP